jgi:hypothetical protein
MHHIVQDNLFNEFGFKTLLDALEENGCQYTVVKVLAHAREGDIIDHNFGPDVVFAHELKLEGSVMVWGATTLGHIAVEKGWKPGRFQNEKFDMRYLKARFGPHFLNDDAQFCPFSELNFEGSKFVRPVHDSKSFSGTLIDGVALAEWKNRIMDLSNDGYISLTPETPVMYAEPKKIDLEARFFIVDGTLVTGSSYRTLGRQIMYQRVDSNNPLFHPMVEFVKDMLAVDCSESDTYDSTYAEPIDTAYVMDIGLCGGEYKVVEINTLNSSGFYASDMGAVVRALEGLNVV